MLHVRGPDIDETPSQALARVHQFLYNKYKQQAKGKLGTKGSAESAALLQEFLTAWKKFVNNGRNTSSIFTNEIMRDLQERIYAANPSLSQNLFKFNVSGGVKFEKDLTNFIYGVLQAHGTTGLNLEDWMAKVNTGSNRTDSTLLDPSQLDKLAYELATVQASQVNEAIAKENQRAIEDIDKLRYGNQTRLLDKPRFHAVQGKTDINTKGASIDIQINLESIATPELGMVLQLLSNATFTAKNYGTSLWTEEWRKKRGMEPGAIHFGDSNIYRAITSVLSSLGWRGDVVNSVFYATYAGHDEEAIRHFVHLRFIYELTGRGQLFDGEYSEINEAEYLVWNDYNSNNIVVKSTGELVQQLMDDVFNADLVSGVHIRFVNLR